MKFLAWILFPVSFCWASNAVFLTDRSGADQVNRSITLPRYFAEGEIAGFAQPRINGQPAPYWQSDVKTRWPDGSVRFALVSLELTIPKCSNDPCPPVVVDFIGGSQVSSGDGAGLTSAEMLAFDTGGGPGSWGARVQASINGISKGASARQMIGKGFFTVLESGPLRHSVLVREPAAERSTSFGFRCTGICKSPYAAPATVWLDGGSDPQYSSMRPSYVVTFYPRWQHVEVDYVLDNGWLDRYQDQRFRLALFEGGGENQQWYDSGSEVVLPAAGRIWEEHWSPAAPDTRVDFNFPYMISTKVVPEWDLRLKVGPAAIAMEVDAFNQTDQGKTVGKTAPHLGWGQWQRAMATAGGRPDIGLFPRWAVRYLYTFDPRLLTVMLGNAKAMTHAPVHLVEPDAARSFDSAGAKAFGHPLSIDARPSFVSGKSGFYTDPAEAPVLVGPVTCYDRTFGGFCSDVDYQNEVNGWTPEIAHQPNAFSLPYLVTGKYVFLEELQFWAGWTVAWGTTGLPPNVNFGRHDTWGFINNTWEERVYAWGLRTLAHAALFSWDATAEKKYFLEKMQYNLGIWEGKLNLLDGSFPPPAPQQTATRGCTSPFNAALERSPWCMGRKHYEQDRPNPLFSISLGERGSGEGVNLAKSQFGGSMWMQNFVRVAFGHLRDLGFPVARIHDALSANIVHQVLDSAYNPYLVAEYNLPVGNSTYTGYLQSWASVLDAFQLSAPLSRPVSSSDSVIELSAFEFYENNVRFSYNYPGFLKIGSELVRWYDASNITQSFTVDPATGVFTARKHGYVKGQLVRVSGNLAPPLEFDQDYVVINPTADTLQLSLDGTKPVRVENSGGPQYFNTIQVRVDDGPDCAKNVCRGVNGTSAASHATGDVVTRVPMVIPQGLIRDVENGYPWFARAAVSFAARYGVATTDEGNGRTLTGTEAWNWIAPQVASDRLGRNNQSCAGLDVHTCDNPQWAFVPHQVPKRRPIK